MVVVLRDHDAEALEFATALHKIASDLPIVFAACSADEIGADELAAAGVSEMIHWPLNSAEIAAALTRCLPIQAPILSTAALSRMPGDD